MIRILAAGISYLEHALLPTSLPGHAYVEKDEIWQEFSRFLQRNRTAHSADIMMTMSEYNALAFSTASRPSRLLHRGR